MTEITETAGAASAQPDHKTPVASITASVELRSVNPIFTIMLNGAEAAIATAWRRAGLSEAEAIEQAERFARRFGPSNHALLDGPLCPRGRRP